MESTGSFNPPPSHTQFLYEVVEVERIENPELWRKYASARHVLSEQKHKAIGNIQTMVEPIKW